MTKQPTGAVCVRCCRRPATLVASKLCGACDMALRRAADKAEDARRGRPFRREPWDRLTQAAKRWTRATDLGWSSIAIASAEEQLKRAAEGYRRSHKKRRTNAGAIRGQPASADGDGCPETTGKHVGTNIGKEAA